MRAAVAAPGMAGGTREACASKIEGGEKLIGPGITDKVTTCAGKRDEDGIE